MEVERNIFDNSTDADMEDAPDLDTRDLMEVAPNIFDHDTHLLMDKEVLGFFPNHPHPPNFSNLLGVIVSGSKKTLDPQYQDTFNADRLVKSQPGLAEKLEKAWQDGTFKEIRNLSANIHPRVWIFLTFVLGAELIRANGSKPMTAMGVPTIYSTQMHFTPWFNLLTFHLFILVLGLEEGMYACNDTVMSHADIVLP